MWYTLGPTGAVRDLWVHPTNDGQPDYGDWLLSDGRDVYQVLRNDGPVALGVPVWWVQERENYGTRVRDMLWDASMCGVKLVSQRLRDVLVACGASLETFEVEIRIPRKGTTVDGFFGVLEERGHAGPVHSYHRGERAALFVISEHVRNEIVSADLTGLQLLEARPNIAFPGDGGHD